MRARTPNRVSTFGLTAFVLLVGAEWANAALIVVPNANAAVAGNTDNRFPFLVSGGMHYQQVFAASQFSAFGGTGQLITEMDLRNGILLHQPFTSTIANIKISLSTTSKAPDGLSSTFASNLGADNTQVCSGSLTMAIS